MPAVNRTCVPFGSADPSSFAGRIRAAGVSPLYNVNVLYSRHIVSDAFLQPHLREELLSFSKDDWRTNGGACQDRTDDLKLAKLALSQLS
jgi:hypothetical protein